MMSSEHRGNDRAFPACVTNLHIIATTHHRSVVRARACWRSHRTRSGYVERGDFNTASLHWTMNHDDRRADQIDRADRFIEQLRDAITATVVDPASACADYQRRGLRRIADTLDAVPYVTPALSPRARRLA
jgi:hypothetical protein